MGSCGLVPLAPHLLQRSLSSRGRRCREADPHPSGSPIVGQVSALPQATPSFPHHIFMTLSSRPSLLQPCRQSLMPASENSLQGRSAWASAITAAFPVANRSGFPARPLEAVGRAPGSLPEACRLQSNPPHTPYRELLESIPLVDL